MIIAHSYGNDDNLEGWDEAFLAATRFNLEPLPTRLRRR